MAAFTILGDWDFDGGVQIITGSTSALLDGVDLFLGTTLCTAIHIGNNVASYVMNGSNFSIRTVNTDVITIDNSQDVTIAANGWNVSAAGGGFFEDGDTMFIGVTVATAITFGNTSPGTDIIFQSRSFDLTSTVGSNISVGGSFSVTSATGATYFDTDQVSIDSDGNVLIAPTDCTNLAFGNAATVTSLVGTEFEAQLTASIVLDANALQFGQTVATIITIGNLAVSMLIAADDMTVLGNSTLQVDCTSVLQLGNADATTIQFGNAAATLTMVGAIPGGAPGGSVNVLWDPVGKQFYHA